MSTISSNSRSAKWRPASRNEASRPTRQRARRIALAGNRAGATGVGFRHGHPVFPGRMLRLSGAEKKQIDAIMNLLYFNSHGWRLNKL